MSPGGLKKEGSMIMKIPIFRWLTDLARINMQVLFSLTGRPMTANL